MPASVYVRFDAPEGECQRHQEGSTQPCRRFWTYRQALARRGPHSSQHSHTDRFMGRVG